MEARLLGAESTPTLLLVRRFHHFLKSINFMLKHHKKQIMMKWPNTKAKQQLAYTFR